MITFFAALFVQQESPKIADLAEPQAQVSVQRGDQVLEVRQIGRRLVNGDLYDGDQVRTGDAAAATVVFADDTRVTLAERAAIVIEQRTLREPTVDGRTIGRSIRILTGHVLSDVVPNPEVMTHFETAAGTAAVRGTRLAIDVGLDDAARIDLDEGTVDFLFGGGQAEWNMDAGDVGRYGFAGSETRYFVEAVEGGEIPGRVGTTQVRCQSPCRMVIEFAEDGMHAMLEQGDALIPDGEGGWRSMPRAYTFEYSGDAPETDPGDVFGSRSTPDYLGPAGFGGGARRGSGGDDWLERDHFLDFETGGYGTLRREAYEAGWSRGRQEGPP